MVHKRNVGLLVTVLLHALTGLSQGVVNPSECRSLMDLYVVLDGSDSIAFDDFLSLKNAMGGLIREIDIGPTKARLGMLVYSSHVPQNSEHPFYNNQDRLLRAAATLEHPRDGTHTELGLRHMRRMFELHGRPDTPWVCVTITDGISKNINATIAEAKLAERLGISMIAVGIGNRIDMNELRGIASTPRQVITLDNFGQLASMIRSMMTTICPCPPTPVVPFSACNDGPRAIGSIRHYECQTGYLLRGSPDIRCLDDSTWTPPSFECVACLDTPTVNHATCGGGENTIGSLRTYTCAPGYKTVGNADIRCLPDATWSAPNIRCVPCGDTPLVDHASCGNGLYTIDSIRTYTCAPGYKTVGNADIRCLPDATWSAPNIRCVPCGDTPLVDHASCGNGLYTIDSIRTYTCAPGYKTVGNADIRCLPDATWSAPNIRCVPCGDTPLVDHASCGDGLYTIDSIRTYTCAPGYKTVGNAVIRCLPDATWSAPNIRCVPCGDTPVVNHASCGDGLYTIDSIRTYTCAPGYKTVGNADIRCLPDATWSAPNIRCVPCGDTPVVNHASCGDGLYTIDSIRTYTCAPGYKTVGNADIRCLPDATWSAPNIRCVPCGDTPLVDHASCGDGLYTIDSIRTYTCAPGYKTVGNADIRCLPDATWSAPNIRCVPCGDTPLVDYASCGDGPYTIDSIRTYTCAPGYMTVGNADIRCLPDATWSAPNIRCVPCGDTPLVDHASCGDGLFTIDSIRTYTCAPGYKTVGNADIRCLPDATWSAPNIRCVPCGTPPDIPFATCGGGENTIGSERIYTCHTGYLAVGPSASIRCEDTALWSQPEIRCIDCGDTPTVAYGSCGAGTQTLGSRRTFTCEQGYFLRGNPHILCRDNATWSLPDFSCDPCAAETPEVPNAVCGSGGVLIGSTRSFTCNDGYLPQGSPTIECLSNAEWSRPTFTCRDCGNPPTLDNAFCGLGPSTIGSTRDFYCEAGFQMVGLAQIRCQADGTWETPSCSCRRITTTTTTTPAPNLQDPNVCDACRLINGVGYNFHPYDCNQYVQCYVGLNGMEPIYRHCPFGQFWDQNVLTCRPSHLVDCPHDQCAFPGVRGYKSHEPDHCCSYWKCQNGRAYGECCGDGFSYDARLGECVYDDECHTACPDEDEIYGCNRRPTLDEVFYEEHIGNNQWIRRPCAPGTAFNPVDCGCSLILMTVPGRTRQQVCRPELYLPFSRGFQDGSGRHTYVENHNVGLVNGSAYFNGHSRLLINRFSNTEFAGNLVIKFRYKEILEGPTAASLQALVTNGDCGSDPSIIAAKMPGYVLLGAKTTEPRSFALPTLDKEWKEVIYIHNERTLEGKVCGATGNKWAYGPIQATHCALQIGYGNGLNSFIGLIDDFYLYQCRPRSNMLNLNY